MNGLAETIAMNERAVTAAAAHRPCSAHINHRGDDGITTIILHSASHRDTMCVTWDEEFQREFFLATLEMYGITLDQVDNETADPAALDKVVESYWGLYPRPEQHTIPGYLDAEDA